MMMSRRIPQEIFKRNPSQSLSGILITHFFAKFQISCEVNSLSYEPSDLSLYFYEYCDKLFEHRIHVRQNLLVSLKKITTWNISGRRPPSYGCDLKMSLIRRHLKRGPVCLQETRWSTSVQICSSEAIPTLFFFARRPIGSCNLVL